MLLSEQKYTRNRFESLQALRLPPQNIRDKTKPTSSRQENGRMQASLENIRQKNLPTRGGCKPSVGRLECGIRITEMNFILPHSFELDLRRECHYLVHRSFSFGVIQIRRSVQKLSSLGSPSADLFEREGFYFTDCSVIRFIDAQERLLLLCFYTGEASRLW